jgi:hypothetical protein
MMDGPLPIGRQVLEEVIALRPNPSIMVPSVVAPDGSSSGIFTAADSSAIVKTVDDAAVVSMPVGDMAVMRKAAYEAVLTKETTAKTVMDSASPSRTPTPAAGAKRVPTPSGSTRPAKHPYRCVWKPRFVESPAIYSLYLAKAVTFHF